MHIEVSAMFWVIDLVGVLLNGILAGVIARRHRFDAVGFAFLAILSALGGGLIRDVVCTETPLLLKREIYATAAAAGAASLVVAHGLGLPDAVAIALGLGTAFTIRAVALAWGLSLPIYRPRAARPR